jgi:hypothetical protein
MVGKLTLLSFFLWDLRLCTAYTFYMDLLRLSEFATMFALGDGTAFLLYLKQGAIGVLAARRPVSLDTCFTRVFFIVYQDLYMCR